jgi:hypothetical protein
MATTLVTIVKVAGPVVAQMREMFRSWDAAVRERCAGADRAFAEVRDQLVAQGKRRKLGLKVYTSEEYRRRLEAYTDPAHQQRVVEQMVALRDALEAHADRPPVVFFRKYLDPWTIGLDADAMLLLGPREGEPLGELIAPFLQALGSREGWSGPIAIALFTPTAPGRLKAELEEGLARYRPANPARGHDWFEQRELYQESRTNRGLRGLRRGRIGIGPHPGVPALEPRPQVLVQDPRSDLQQPMSPMFGPAHLLLLDHPLADHLIDRRFRE